MVNLRGAWLESPAFARGTGGVRRSRSPPPVQALGPTRLPKASGSDMALSRLRLTCRCPASAPANGPTGERCRPEPRVFAAVTRSPGPTHGLESCQASGPEGRPRRAHVDESVRGRQSCALFLRQPSQLYQRDDAELDLVCAVDAGPMNPRSSNYEIVDQPSISRTALCRASSASTGIANQSCLAWAGGRRPETVCDLLAPRTRRRTSTGRHECREKFEQGCRT